MAGSKVHLLVLSPIASILVLILTSTSQACPQSAGLHSFVAMIRSNEGSEDRNEVLCKLGPLSEASRPELHANITWMARLSAGRRGGSRVSAACFSHSSRAKVGRKNFYAFPLSAPFFGPCDITGLWHVMPIFTEPQTRLWPLGFGYSGIDWLLSRFPRFLWLLWPSVKQHVAR
jgi:hypothetical protein